MESLDQIRARKASEVARKYGVKRSDVAGLPALIINNGLLPAAAFVCEDNEARNAKRQAFDGVAEHLGNPKLRIDILNGCSGTQDLFNRLTEPREGGRRPNSQDLQRATAEALEFLAYLKRRATKG